MRSVDSLLALNIPNDYKNYINHYIKNISDIPFVDKIFLFGSCARGTVSKYSDIDFFITTTRDISEDEEMQLTMHSLPEYSVETIPTDIIVQSDYEFNEYIGQLGMVQNQVHKEGVNLSGLLHKRDRN